MPDLTRRDLFKTGAAVAAARAAPAVEAEPAKAISGIAASPQPEIRERLKFDFGWKFHLGHAGDPAKDFGYGRNLDSFAKAGFNIAACAMLDFDDAGWAAVDLPHDWAMELPYMPPKHPPPSGAANSDDPAAGHGYKPLGRDWPENSVGWYRRVFEIPQGDRGKRIAVEFDGVFRDAAVTINGYLIARNQSGYASFCADLTDFLDYGGKNVLCVRVDATLGEGWFYEGAGIYRHVWLTKTDALHVPQWGTFVHSDIVDGAAELTIETDVRNDGMTARNFALAWQIFDPAGRVVAQATTPTASIGSLSSRTLVRRVRLENPALWSLETPQLYRLVSRVIDAGRAVDDYAVDFGLRTVRFDPEKGFFLNGRPVKLNGTCNHQDHAGVGTAVPDRLQYWRVERLKEFGCNATRMAHNPPAPELLDACDRLGMLVVDETRRMSSDPESLDELSRMLKRDRNHPSIILWSIGNEEPQQGTERGARIAASIVARVRELDPTRPLCAAINDPAAWESAYARLLDVVGANYLTGFIRPFHRRNPQRTIIGTETGSTVATRGIYRRDPASGYCVAYDTEHPWWANTAEEWLRVVAPAPYIAGGFVWTGFDYHGEPTPFNRWPNTVSQFGVMDLCGFPKDNYYYYKAWWRPEPLLHLFPHWNWTPGETVCVWCHSNLDAVELFVNGESHGVRKVPRFGHAEWNVTFAPGVIEARGYQNGVTVATDRRETAGPAARVVLAADRTEIDADGEDVCVVAATVTDAQGRMVPDAGHRISFELSGPGKIVGVGNGDPRSVEPERTPVRSAFNGLCSAIVQADRRAGEIVVRAVASGLVGDAITVSAKRTAVRPFVP
jgi:beta-galactosidase